MPYNTLYAGMDIETWFLLARDDQFSMQGMAIIPKLQSRVSCNPCNILWKRLYTRYSRGKAVHSVVLRLLAPFLTSTWRRYSSVFLSVVERKAALVDFDDPTATAYFMCTCKTDLLVVNAWGLLPDAIIDTPRYKTVNVHPSKLPQYRGAVPTLMTLKNRDADSAVSYIVLDSTIDGGGLIGQHGFMVDKHDDYRTIEDKVASIVRGTLIGDIKHYLAGNQPRPQRKKDASITPTYYRYMKIDWQSELSRDIYNKINLYPYVEVFDYCYCFVGLSKVCFKGIQCARTSLKLSPGEFVVRGFTLYIGASDASLKCTLFRHLSPGDSLKVFLRRSGKLTLHKGEEK